MRLNFNINLTKKQKEAYNIIKDDETRFLIARWSRQSGKTVLATILLIEYLVKPNAFSAYISPTFAQGRMVFSQIMSLLEGTGIVKSSNASELKITSITGSVLKFFSIEAATSIRGNTISGILVCDEMAFFPNMTANGESPYWNVIYPTIKARKPKCLFISTPNGRQNIFYDLYTKALNGVKGYRTIKATIYDDELISKDDIEEMKRNYPPLAWKQEFEVEWLDNALTVFPDFDKRFDGTYSGGGRCWCGIDPSSVGEDNTIVTFINDRNEVRQYKIDGTLDSKYAQISSLINSHKPDMTYIESNSIGAVMANEIEKRLERKSRFQMFSTTNDTKKEYISLIAVAIANGDIHFEEDNKLLYTELSTFSYKLTKLGKITYAAREGFHDDCVTSLGIAMQCREDNNRPIHLMDVLNF